MLTFATSNCRNMYASPGYGKQYEQNQYGSQFAGQQGSYYAPPPPPGSVVYAQPQGYGVRIDVKLSKRIVN